MEHVINYTAELLSKTFAAVLTSLAHNWKVLGFAIILAVVLKTYVNSDKLSQLLFKRKKISIFASVAFGAFTPLCACGTMAVIIGMLTTTFPWGPIMAFLTSSPLMSPDGFVLISGIISLKFAIALTVASLVIGISSGFITNIIEKRTRLLVGQSRFADKAKAPACSCGSPAPDKAPSLTGGCSCGTAVKPAETAGGCNCRTEEITTPEITTPAASLGCTCSTSEEAASITDGCSCNADGTAVIPSISGSCTCSDTDETKNGSITSAVRNCCEKIATAVGNAGNAVKSIFIKSKYYKTDLGFKPQTSYVKPESSFIRKVKKAKLDQFVGSIYTLGLKQILFYYMIFVAVGYLINSFVPSSIISVLFGANTFFAVPLASLIGLPLYITTDSGIPIIQSMLQSGASEGAMLAFIITGSATSAWVIAGLATFLKKRAIMLYVAFVLVGGILSGYLLDFVNLFL
jgi:uncharacterized membrane protein YraQ (UPF0718 family)